MKSTRTLFLARRLLHRDRQLLPLLSELLADRLEIRVLEGAKKDEDSFERVLFAHRPRPGESVLLWMSSLSLSPLAPRARELGYRIVLDHPGYPSPPPFRLRDLTSLLRQAQWRSRKRSDELQLCKDADVVLVRSDQEAARLTRLIPDAEVQVLPSAIDSALLAPLRAHPGEAILLSGDYRDPAQLNGLRWFITECLPFLRARFKDQLPRIIVNHEFNPEFNHDSRQTELLDFLRDIPGAMLRIDDGDPACFERALRDAMLFVIPFHEESRAPGSSQAYNQTRILQAMAAGRGVISTGAGTSGLLLSPTYDVWIAEAPDRFAAALVQLLDNAELRRQLTQNAIQTVDQRYDLGQSTTRIREILLSLKNSIQE